MSGGVKEACETGKSS